MKPVTFYFVAGLTAAAVVAAAVAVSMQTDTTSLTAGTKPALPKLASDINGVAKIELKNAKNSFSIARSGEGWGLVEKDGYAVEFEKVKSAIVSVAEFKLIEQKTSDPARYGRLELNPPTSPEAKSTRLVFKNEKNDVLADVLIGKLNTSLFGQGGAGTYVRRADEKATWLVRGQVTLGEEPNNWMVRQIVNYGKEKVRKVTIKGPDGTDHSIIKDRETDQNFVLQNIPKGRKIKAKDEADPLGGVTWRMMFDDVKLASKQKWPSNPWVAHFYTWDGLDIRIETVKFGDDHWGRFKAAVDPYVTDAKKREAAQKKADGINARTDGWTYMLTAGDAEKLTAKIDYFLADPKKKGS